MLDHLFKPRSIAVIGASRDEGKVGHAVLRNLINGGFKGPIYPVNPNATEILGLKCYSSLSNINAIPEQIIVAVPPTSAVEVIKDAVRIRVRSAVVLTAGFRETGPEGLQLEEKLRAILKNSNMRLLGPNCLGVISTENNLNATFGAGMLPRGRCSFFSQSGALGIAILDWAIGSRIGFSKFVSLGNKLDLNEIDFMEYFLDDPDTELIIGYIEDVVDGRRFLEVARRVTKQKPVLLIKSGNTGAGARAASSHTGALAGSEVAFNAAFKQTGILRAETIEELFNLVKAFSSGRLPKGNRLLIVTNAGGPGIIAADTAEKSGLELPLLSQTTVEELTGLLPGNASLYNPVDIIGDANAERYKQVLKKTIKEPYIDGLLVILTPQAMIDVEAVADIIIEESKNTSKPIIACFMGEARVKKAIEKMESHYIPCFSFPEIAVKSFKKTWDFYRWKTSAISNPATESSLLSPLEIEQQKARNLINSHLNANRYELTENDAMDILSCYGFVFPKRLLARSLRGARQMAPEIGFPLVMKVSSPQVLHKTEVGGVRLNINSIEEVEDAFIEITTNVKRLIPSAIINGVMLYEQVKGGKEVIAGITTDRTFGPMVMIGLGGIYVEVFKDVSFRIVPVTRDDAISMIDELMASPILKGVRGERPVDINALAEAILRLSRLALDFSEIIELDINPIIVRENGAIALDARIIIQRRQT